MDDVVRIVIGAASGALVRECAEVAGQAVGLEVRQGSVAECGWDCDAVLINAPLAHERYGGVPVVGDIQVLANRRGDGAPPWIITTIPLAMPGPEDHLEYDEYLFRVLDQGLVQLRKVLRYERRVVRLLVHLEAAAFDRKPLTPLVEAVLKIIGLDDRDMA